MTPPLLLVVLLLPARAQEPQPDARTWLGHSWVGNERSLPVLGTLRTRTDTWVLARIVDHGDHLVVEQRPCALEIKPVAGVRVGMDPAAVPRLPAARFSLEDDGTGQLSATSWTTGWDEEDLDRDGEPGVTMRVRSPLCGGRLQVASQARSSAQARLADDVLQGTLQVSVEQRILGATGPCLRIAARDSTEQVHGSFRYVPAPAGASCDSLERGDWPVAPEQPPGG